MTSLGVMALRMHHPLLAAGAALLALTLATACSPTPAPTPSPTGFASEEEAFAAAEATVREYFEAASAIDLSDPKTFEPLFDLTTADQNAFDRKRYSEYQAEEYSITGASNVVAVQPRSWDPETQASIVDACVDVSALDLRRADGTSVVSPDRPDKQDLQIQLAFNSGRFLIASIAGSDRPICER